MLIYIYRPNHGGAHLRGVKAMQEYTALQKPKDSSHIYNYIDIYICESIKKTNI